MPVTVLTHAITAARHFLDDQQQEFLDEAPLESNNIYLGFDDFTWQEFLKHYYKVAK